MVYKGHSQLTTTTVLYKTVQRSAKRYANLAKQDPGRGRNKLLVQPRTSLLADLCTKKCQKAMCPFLINHTGCISFSLRQSQKQFGPSSGIERLSNLVVFRMNYDCTDRILRAVVENNGGRLRVVDIRNSQYVTDAGEGFKKFNIYFTKHQHFLKYCMNKWRKTTDLGNTLRST